MKDNKIICPICSSQTKKTSRLEKDKISDGIRKTFNVDVPKDLIPYDFDLYTCFNCTLTFSSPLIQGDKKYYDFLTTLDGYYVDERPEYSFIKNLLLLETNKVKLLDVGCGDGAFLEKIKDIKNVDSTGIDLTESSIKKALKKGLNVYQTTVEDFEQKNFDIIVAFHCIEHIENPTLFLNEIINKLAINGKVFLSTPYSPMIEEYYWFNALNNPPHHMLRFNEKSYKKLAEILNLSIKFHNFEEKSFKNMVHSALSYAKYGEPSKFSFTYDILSSPLLSFKCLLKVIRRDKIYNKYVGNNIIVELKKND
jgi:2-polyprenyl-3-methyl-5-hydroxy-6-metoxy-1,4-benzoquinol methylase